MTVILLTSGAVLTVTCGTFLIYELVTFRQSMVRGLSTLAQAIAANSTAALAFENADDATQVLSALAADPHVVAAALYDEEGVLFASYGNPAAGQSEFPPRPDRDGYRFGQATLSFHQPVMIETRRLGTLYLQSDLGAMSQRFTLYGGMLLGVIAVASLVAFVLATRLQRHITQPVLARPARRRLFPNSTTFPCGPNDSMTTNWASSRMRSTPCSHASTSAIRHCARRVTRCAAKWPSERPSSRRSAASTPRSSSV
jgi:uncharacterized membrane protein affecting hemolysin expression